MPSMIRTTRPRRTRNSLGACSRATLRLAREGAGLSQERFAAALGLPVATLRNWEQGRTNPDPAARALMRLVRHDPAHAFRVLAPEALLTPP